MIKAACHCTAVRLEAETPTWVNDCNCSICKRYGVLWAYYQPGQVRLLPGYDRTQTYVWGDKELAFHRCADCGCVTHWTVIGADPPLIRGVNVRMMPSLDPASVILRQTDNAHSGWFWTRVDGPVVKGSHPPITEPNEWR